MPELATDPQIASASDTGDSTAVVPRTQRAPKRSLARLMQNVRDGSGQDQPSNGVEASNSLSSDTGTTQSRDTHDLARMVDIVPDIATLARLGAGVDTGSDDDTEKMRVVTAKIDAVDAKNEQIARRQEIFGDVLRSVRSEGEQHESGVVRADMRDLITLVRDLHTSTLPDREALVQFGSRYATVALEAVLPRLFGYISVEDMPDEVLEAFDTLNDTLLFDYQKGVKNESVQQAFDRMKELRNHQHLQFSRYEQDMFHNLRTARGLLNTRDLDFSRFMSIYDHAMLKAPHYFYRDGDGQIRHSQFGLAAEDDLSENLVLEAQDELETLHKQEQTRVASESGPLPARNVTGAFSPAELQGVVLQQTVEQQEVKRQFEEHVRQVPAPIRGTLRVYSYRLNKSHINASADDQLEWVRSLMDVQNSDGTAAQEIPSQKRSIRLSDFFDQNVQKGLSLLQGINLSDVMRDVLVVTDTDEITPETKFAMIVPPNYDVRKVRALFPGVAVISDAQKEKFGRFLTQSYAEIVKANGEDEPQEEVQVITPSEEVLPRSVDSFTIADSKRGVIGLFSSDDKRESEEISSIAGTQYLEQMIDHPSTTIGRSRKNFRRGARFTKRMVKNKSFAATAVQVFGTESDQPVAVISRKGNHVVYQVTPDGKVVRLTPPGKRNMMFANSQPLESIVPVDKGSVLIVSPADIPMSAWASAAKIGGMPQQIVDLAVKMGQHPKMAGSFQLTAVAMQV